MKATRAPLAGQRIGFFGRGGSGKSTCLVFVAGALAKAGYSVCVVDADSTNEGLPQALGADRTPAPLLDWFGGTVFSGGPVTCPVDDPTPIRAAHMTEGELPAEFVGRSQEGIRVFVAGKIGPLGPGAGCDGPMTKIARDFAFRPSGTEPVTLVDFKAGIEDASRGVITSLDWVVVVVDPSQAGARAAVSMKRMLDQIRDGHLPATQHLASPELAELTRRAYREARTRGALYVLNRMPDAETEHFLLRYLREAQIHPLASIPDDPTLRQAWLRGTRLHSVPAEAAAAQIIEALESGRGRFTDADMGRPARLAGSQPRPQHDESSGRRLSKL